MKLIFTTLKNLSGLKIHTWKTILAQNTSIVVALLTTTMDLASAHRTLGLEVKGLAKLNLQMVIKDIMQEWFNIGKEATVLESTVCSQRTVMNSLVMEKIAGPLAIKIPTLLVSNAAIMMVLMHHPSGVAKSTTMSHLQVMIRFQLVTEMIKVSTPLNMRMVNGWALKESTTLKSNRLIMVNWKPLQLSITVLIWDFTRLEPALASTSSAKKMRINLWWDTKLGLATKKQNSSFMRAKVALPFIILNLDVSYIPMAIWNAKPKN